MTLIIVMQSEGDNVIGSVHPCVALELSCLIRLTLPTAAKGNYPHIWSKGWMIPVRGFFLSVIRGAYADNFVDAVDRILMAYGVLTLMCCLFDVKMHKPSYWDPHFLL